MTVLVNGATLACARCSKRFLPEKLYRGDPLHIEMGDAISSALTKELISE